MASKLLELFVRDKTDLAVLVSGDTDLVPAIETAKALFADKRIMLLFPYRRWNDDLLKSADHGFKLTPSHYLKFQLLNPYCKKNGDSVTKPATW